MNLILDGVTMMEIAEIKFDDIDIADMYTDVAHTRKLCSASPS